MALTKGFARNNAKTPLDQRLADMATIVCNADGSPRVGVLGNANASIVTHGGGMNLAVAAAEFVTSKGKADGVMIFTNNGSVNVLIGAAPASNSRIDVLWVKHEDNTTGDAASLPIFGVTAGVAGAVPVKPAIPTGALELATLRIYSGTVATNGGANTLTNTYQMTQVRGGVVPFRTKADLLLWTNPVRGQKAVVFADGTALNNQNYEWSGLVWTPDRDTTTIPNQGTTVWDITLTRIGNRVFADGRALKSSGTFGTGTVEGVVPAGWRPIRSETFVPSPGLTTGFAWAYAPSYILANGNIQTNMNGAANIGYIGFSGVNWSTS